MSECIEWGKSKNKYGYGKSYRDGKHITAHRLVFFDCNGWFPEVVKHTCDNPGCVNPAHLEAGTWKSNMDDKYERGRAAHVKGEKHGMAKITPDVVHWIRASSLDNVTVGDWLGMNYRSIWAIRARKSWKHI